MKDEKFVLCENSLPVGRKIVITSVIDLTVLSPMIFETNIEYENIEKSMEFLHKNSSLASLMLLLRSLKLRKISLSFHTLSIMDYIFDCFYEDIFENLERSGLRSRKSRENVIDRLNVLICGCSSGQNVPVEDTSRLAIESAIKFHQTMKTQNSEVCKMGKFHNILYIALKLAWNWGVKDTIVISSLLIEIYDCERTFERLFLGMIFGSNAPYFIAGWRSDFKDQDENTRAAVFFLHHACKAKLHFKINDQKTPFIDIPIESCGLASPLRVSLQASAPDILLILLRHGANPNPYDGGVQPVLALMDKLLEYEDENKSYPYQLVSCLRIIILSIPFIEMPFKPLLYDARRQMFIEKYSSLLTRKMIPINRVFGVVELKHLCKCSIRESLRKNCQLPDGIKELKIPRSLKRYVDLLQE